MSEAPLPKKNFSIKSDKNNTFNIEFYADQASFLNIKINSVNKIPSISYSEKLSLSDITKKNKYFLICENISDVLNILEPIIKISENIKLTEKSNELVLNINVPNPLSPNLIFEIKAQKKDLNLSIEELYEINNKLNNRINILEKTVHDQQKIILSLDERLKKIEEKNLKKNEQSLINNSKIIGNNRESENIIKDWISPNKNISFNLIYRMTRDGTSLNDFHKLCDNKGSTLLLIETDKNYKFGGYTPLDYENSEKYKTKTDESTFLFSLNKLKKFTKIKNGKSLSVYYDYGAIFGEDDLVLGKTNIINKGWTSDGLYLTNHELTNGEKNFNCKEVEVFQVNFY